MTLSNYAKKPLRLPKKVTLRDAKENVDKVRIVARYKKLLKTQVKNYTPLHCTCGCVYVNLLISIDFLISLVGPTPKSD